MIKEDILDNTSFSTNKAKPPFEELQNWRKVGSFYRIKNQEEKKRKYLMGWGPLARGERERGRECRAWGKLGLLEAADWKDCISDPVGHLGVGGVGGG